MKTKELSPQLLHIRDTAVWLYDYAGLSSSETALVLRVHPSVITRTLKRRPDGWTPNNDSFLSRVLAK